MSSNLAVNFSRLRTALLFLAAAPLFAQSPAIGGCPVFPADNVWNARVDKLPVDSRSGSYVASMGAARTLHPDFGAGLYNGASIGIPFNLVPGNQARVRVS